MMALANNMNDFWEMDKLPNTEFTATPKTADELQEAISFLKGLCEELLLSKTNFTIEVYSQKQ